VTDEARVVERALAALMPRASNLGRDRMMFLAGQASVQTSQQSSAFSRWAWPMATCVSTAAALMMATLLVTRSAPEADSKHASVENTATPDAPTKANPELPSNPGNDNRAAPDAWSSQPNRQSQALAAAKLSERPNYLQLRSYVLSFGLDDLPEGNRGESRQAFPPQDERPVTQRELLQDLLDSDIRRQDNRL